VVGFVMGAVLFCASVKIYKIIIVSVAAFVVILPIASSKLNTLKPSISSLFSKGNYRCDYWQNHSIGRNCSETSGIIFVVILHKSFPN
jgi:hypothetical protein